MTDSNWTEPSEGAGACWRKEARAARHDWRLPGQGTARAPWVSGLILGVVSACGSAEPGSDVAGSEGSIQGSMQGSMQGLAEDQLGRSEANFHASPPSTALRGHLPPRKPWAPPSRPFWPPHRQPPRHGPHPPRGGAPSDPCQGPPSFQEISLTGIGATLTGAPPALNNQGQVLLSGIVAGVPNLLLGDGATVARVDIGAQGFGAASRVAIDDAGHWVFLASPSAPEAGSAGPLFGLFATDASGATAQTIYAATAGGGLGDGGELFNFSFMALGASGMLAFSTIRNGVGALYRGPVAGPLETLVSNSPPFFNSQDISVNAAGVVTLQMEHSACGLQRGVLVFDAPGTTLDSVRKAAAGFDVSQQPDASINDSGAVALALEGAGPTVSALRCPTGEPAERFTLDVGVYLSTPTALSARPDLTLVADTRGAFGGFSAVELSNAGALVFQATLDSGETGLFTGPDAVADRLLLTGDTLGGERVDSIQLGELNDRCQLAVITTGTSGRRAWRVAGIAP